MELPDSDASTPDRFELERRLGAGGFGSVFVALDRERNQRVALKRLERLDAPSVYRFKQEFRALADISHPNLVKLHELFSQTGGWCFTMELVDGVPFDQWVRGPSAAPRRNVQDTSTQPDLTRATESDREPTTREEPLRAALFHERRLRDALAQLALGVAALHAHGILHRDLKPSNVLVDRRGRVVILDFGMVATGVVDVHESIDGPTVGTPAYMSPEQARGAPLTVAADWYAVGTMLYEALTGRLPFSGTPIDILTAKASRAPRDPNALVADLPADLASLCVSLLEPDAGSRPSGPEILRRLDVEVPSTTGQKHALLGTFVGRYAERSELRRAFEASRAGHTVVAHVHGASGHGKSTLVRSFLSELTLHDEVVVLDGRCYERESVPFKALDELVDAL